MITLQACPGMKNSEPVMKEFFDLEEQHLIRSDCNKLVEKLGNDEIDHLSVLSDLESIITTYSDSTNVKYFSDNGWLEIIQPLLALKITKCEIYNRFEAIHKRYVPSCFNSQNSLNKQSFHLLRLLLFYHDPELCSFLDTKKIGPESYALSWFRSLFAAHCNIKTILNLWNSYFQLDNPFLVFFLALVMLVNSKEDIMGMKNECRETIIKAINSVPSAIDVGDISDLFYLVEEHYISQTPKCINELHNLIFSYDVNEEPFLDSNDLANVLCLPIPVSHLLPNSCNSRVRFFIVDCRPAEQYNNGHLSTAFHLDCSLMLQEPAAFNTAVQALLAAQKQAIRAGSVAGGKHLCFIGSGRDEEDRYVHMVVASFLQKHHAYVSLAFGGYAALHDYVSKRSVLDKYLMDHNKNCLACRNPTNFSKTSPLRSISSSNSSLTGNASNEIEHFSSSSLFDKFANVMKRKSAEVKVKLIDYINNPAQEKHISADKLGKRYRGPNVFTLLDADNGDGLSRDGESIEINIETWCKAQEALGCFKCEEITEEHRFSSFLVLTKYHLYLLREIPHNKGFATIIAKRPLEMIVQITSKKRMPDLITIRYGQSNDEEKPSIMAVDRLKIPEEYEVGRLVKQQIVRVREGLIDET